MATKTKKIPRVTAEVENAREYLERVAAWAAWQCEDLWCDISPATMIRAYEMTKADGVEAVEHSKRASKLIGIEPAADAV